MLRYWMDFAPWRLSRRLRPGGAGAPAAAIAVAALVLGASTGCSDRRIPPQSAPEGPAPDTFSVAFETSRGRFVAAFVRAWSPNGVDRVHKLVSTRYFDRNYFFRVVPNFVAQFGAGDDKAANAYWDSLAVTPDPRVERNLRGTISFAQTSPDTRTRQLFVNLKDNPHLDGMGFTPVGRVVEGMDVVDSLYSGYGNRPDFHLISTIGSSYVRSMFPKLDLIRTARIEPAR